MVFLKLHGLEIARNSDRHMAGAGHSSVWLNLSARHGMRQLPTYSGIWISKEHVATGNISFCMSRLFQPCRPEEIRLFMSPQESSNGLEQLCGKLRCDLSCSMTHVVDAVVEEEAGTVQLPQRVQVL